MKQKLVRITKEYKFKEGKIYESPDKGKTIYERDLYDYDSHRTKLEPTVKVTPIQIQ